MLEQQANDSDEAELSESEKQLLTKFMRLQSKRDHELLNQLATLNQNLTQQNSQLCRMFTKVMKKQQALINNLKHSPKAWDEKDKEDTNSTQLEHSIKHEKAQTRNEPLKRTVSNLSRQSEGKYEAYPTHKNSEENVRFQVNSPIAVVHFSDKELLVDIGPIAQEIQSKSSLHQFNLKLATLAISRWIAEVYDRLSRETFTGFYSRHISQTEAKVFFTHNMALNFEHMTRWFWKYQPELWREHKHRLLLHFEIETAKNLDFMMVKYPQKKKTFISEEYREAIPVMDKSTDTQFDIVVSSGCFFKYDPSRRDYYRQIKLFLNKLILESRNHYKGFRRIMRDVFKVGTIEIRNQIGMKLREGTPLFTKEEITSDGLEIQMPEILRIIVKWIEELQRRIQRIADGSILYSTFSRKDNLLQPEYLTKDQIKVIGELVNREQMTKLANAAEELKVRIRSLLSLLPQYLDKHEPYFEHIRSNEVRSGLLSYILSETAKNLSVNYLVFLIHFLQNISTELWKRQGKPDDPRKRKLEFSFVSFNVADLLRCRCSGTLSEIRIVYDNLCRHPELTIYRIKNRLDTSNRDFLLNVKINDTPMLCEVQLTITDNSSDERDVFLNQFSHFIYELSRAKYGPIGQAVMINTHLTDFAPFFEKSLNRIHDTTSEPPKDLQVEHCSEGRLEVVNFICRDNRFTFLCSNCLCFKKAHENYYAHFDNCSSFLACEEMKMSTNLDKQRILCVDCVVTTMKETDQQLYLIGPTFQTFFGIADFEEFRNDMLSLNAQESGDEENYVCLVQKASPVRAAEVFEIKKINTQLRFIPVFYETSKKKEVLTLDELQDYYIFKWKPGSVVKHKTAQDLKRILSEQTYLELEEEDLVEIIRTLTLAFLPSFAGEISPRGTKHSLKKDSEREQIKDISIRNIDFMVPGKTVVFASPLVTMETLNNMNKEMLAVAINHHSNLIIVLSTIYHLDQLKRLNTIGRQLTQGELTMMATASIWNMNERDLGDNSFSVVKEELRNVRTISLQKNKITRVDFINSPSVAEINLANNGIKKLRVQSTMFPSLERLILSKNRVVQIECVKHNNLRRLIMRECGVQVIDFSLWELPFLEELDLGFNSLVELDLSEYDLSNLVRLNIGMKQCHSEDNLLEYITLPLNLESLQELILKNNHLRTMDLKLHILTSIVTLELRQNLLQAVTLPNDMQTLYELYIFNNRLRSVDLSKLRLPKLGNLHLEQNRLERVELPWDLPELKWLNLADNRLKSIDLSKIRLPRLKVLNLERNRIEVFRLSPEAKMLEELDVHANRLTTINFAHQELWHLKTLDASLNLLEQANLGKYLPNLESLNLNRNCLIRLDFRVCQLRSLTSLSFEYNFIEEVLFNDVPMVAPRLEVVKANYNPFQRVPSNICLVPGCSHFPQLKTVECGVPQLEKFGVWILMGFSEAERNELYKLTSERLGREIDMAGVKLCLRLKSKIEERLRYVKQDIIAIVETIYVQGRIPSVFEPTTEEHLKLLHDQ